MKSGLLGGNTRVRDIKQGGREIVLFLSYAEEDERTAANVAKALRAQGCRVYDWRDHERQAGLFIREIESAIQQAEAFIALLSPSFITSPWCRREREFAMQREMDLQVGDAEAVFIYVLRIVPGAYADAGFLRSYSWVDLNPRDEIVALGTLAGRLGPIGQGEPVENSDTSDLELAAPLFRNRSEELDKVLRVRVRHMTLLLPFKASGLTVWALELQSLAFESQLDKHTVNVQLLMGYCNDCMWTLLGLRPSTGSG